MHQLLWRLKIKPHEFMEMPDWSRKIITASLKLQLEAESEKRGEG